MDGPLHLRVASQPEAHATEQREVEAGLASNEATDQHEVDAGHASNEATDRHVEAGHALHETTHLSSSSSPRPEATFPPLSLAPASGPFATVCTNQLLSRFASDLLCEDVV